jgi:hypothetical protein
MCRMEDMVRLGLSEALGKVLCTIGHRIASAKSGTERAVLVMLLEQAVAHFLPMLSAAEDAATAREKRAAALRAALEDARVKPVQLKVALGHKSQARVSRMLTGEEPIPDRIYTVPELGPAFHRREGQLFGFAVTDDKRSA